MLAVPTQPARKDRPYQLSSGTFEAELHRAGRERRRRADTEEDAVVGETAVAHEIMGASRTSVEGAAPTPAPAPEPPPQPEPEDDAGPRHRGEVAAARRILVECGLCGYLVRIPAEFFGKTVHCPECAGDTVFSESTLDPVKEELLDRLTLETNERRVLFEPGRPGGGWGALRSFLVGVGLGLVVLTLVWAATRGG